MVTIRNAAPRVILRGIQDLSGRPPVIDPEMIPTHLPHVFIYSERGPRDPQLVSGDAMVRMYGARTFDYRGPYANHQTVLVNTVNARGNQLMVQRIIPEDAAPPATLTLSLDLLPAQVPQYERNLDGTIKRDADGNPIETGETVQGYIGKWVIGNLDYSGDTPEVFGQRAPRVGEQVGDNGVQSTLYPIMDLEVAHVGAYGNRIGARFSAPTTRSSVPADEETVANQNAYLYRVQLVERSEDAVTPRVIQTNAGEQYIDFSFKPGTINTRIDKELFFDDIFLDAYQELEPNGQPPKFGPFGRAHVYHTHLEEVLQQIYESEVAFGMLPQDPDDVKKYIHLINIFTGVDINGIHYYSYKVLGPSEGGAQLTENSTHYAAGGSDGTMSLEDFDRQVGEICANYDRLEWPLLDTALYPQSVIYDTGFSIETKKKMLYPISVRKDMWVVLSTQDVSEPQLSASEESSVAIALRAAARLYPESEIYGTETCRAIIIGHSGYLINSQYKGLLPLTIEFADKCAQYMGSGDGVWRAGYGFDVPGQNHVRMFKGVNNTFKPANVRNNDWDNGLVWVQNYDRRSLFFPAVQTVYNDDTSVLNAAITMMACVELEKVAERVWRDLTGISYLTNEQFIERSDRLIEEAVKGRFDNRFVIVPTTTITGNDEQRGFSWSTEITIYAPNMKTVGSFTITARRRDDLE